MVPPTPHPTLTQVPLARGVGLEPETKGCDFQACGSRSPDDKHSMALVTESIFHLHFASNLNPAFASRLRAALC